MSSKQVFVEYPYEGQQGIDRLKFCPVCGAACQLRAESDRVRPICPKCGFVQYRNPNPAVSVLIVVDGKVLLGKRADWNHQGGKWCLPCGFIEFDEDYLTAGRREVKEETGLEVEIDGIINVTHNFFNPSLHNIVVVLMAHIVGGELAPNDDIVALEWFDPAEPLPELAFNADQSIIKRLVEEDLTIIEV